MKKAFSNIFFLFVSLVWFNISANVNPVVGEQPLFAVIRVPEDYPTIQQAVDAASDDDIIILSVGVHMLSEPVVIDKSITLTSEFVNTDDEADIDATIITSAINLDPLVLFSSEASNSKCIGITFRDAHKQLTTEAEYIEVTNCKFYDNGSDALSIEAGGGYFAYNYFENNGDEAIDADDSLDWIAEYNTIINPGDDGFEIRLHNNDFSERTHIIRHNYISGADEDGIQLIDYDGDSGRKFKIHNNIIRNSAMVGLGCTKNANTVEDFEGSYMVEEVLVYNNVFDKNNHGITGANNMLVANNIIVNSAEIGIKKLDNNSFSDFNCFYNNAADFENAANEENNIFQEPLLNSDYTLAVQSPCIDKGTTYISKNNLTLDIVDANFTGEGIDVGAKEYESDVVVENSAPTVDLGENQVLIAPENTVQLLGNVNDDGLPQDSDLTFLWTQESGPADGLATFSQIDGLSTEITFSKQGIYELKLKADDGEYESSDKIAIAYVNDFNDNMTELTGSDYIEAEDYRYLIGEAKVNSNIHASDGEIVELPHGSEVYGYTEHRLVTFQEGTYYVWINATGLNESSNELNVAFNDLENQISVETGTFNSYGDESWVMVAFENIPEGVYPLRISASEAGVSWDRIFISTNANERPFKISEEALTLYPVPNDGNFIVALNNTEPTKIQVFDIRGVLVYTITVSDKSFVPLDIGIIGGGVYVVKIENSEETITKKILIN